MGASDKLEVEAIVALGLGREQAEALVAGLDRAAVRDDRLATWRHASKTLLTPEQPFALHQLVHRAVFSEWTRGPAPTWVPSDEEIAASNLGQAMGDDYFAFQRRSVEQPEPFWSQMLQRLGVVFATPPTRVLDDSAGAERARWLPGARLNIAQSALSGPGDRLALVVGHEDGRLERRTLGELRAGVQQVRRALAAAGLSPGDAIAIDTPMTYESVLIYLGVVALGGAVVSIADSFAAAEIAARLRISGAVAIFTQDVILRGGKRLPLYQRVVEASSPRAIVLAAEEGTATELRSGDIDWPSFLALAAEPTKQEDCYAICDVDDVTNILFSSGTTGDPKAIPWTHATPIKAATDGWGHHDIRPGDVVAWPTNLGWMMGPWLIYASLLGGAALALYQGSPLGRDFGLFVEGARVTMLGVVPSLVRGWRASGCLAGLDWSAIRCFSSTGEASNHDEMWWLMARAGYKPVIEYCGGTEIGGGYISGTVVQPQAPAAFSTAALGSDFVILDEDGEPTDNGELALVAPMLGSSERLLNRDHHEVYFEGMPPGPGGQVLRRHGDQMEALGYGYYRAHGRVDDTMNLGGIKTSSAEIERVTSHLPGVRETAAIAVPPPGGGPSQLVIYVVVEEGSSGDAEALRAAMQRAIREQLNPLFKIHQVRIAELLPRTASNKVMRRVLRKRHLEDGD